MQNNLPSVERSELERNSAFLTITVEIKCIQTDLTFERQMLAGS